MHEGSPQRHKENGQTGHTSTLCVFVVIFHPLRDALQKSSQGRRRRSHTMLLPSSPSSTSSSTSATTIAKRPSIGLPAGAVRTAVRLLPRTMRRSRALATLSSPSSRTASSERNSATEEGPQGLPTLKTVTSTRSAAAGSSETERPVVRGTRSGLDGCLGILLFTSSAKAGSSASASTKYWRCCRKSGSRPASSWRWMVAVALTRPPGASAAVST